MKKLNFINTVKVIVLTLLCITVLPIDIYGQEANANNSVAYSKKGDDITYYSSVTEAVNAGMKEDITIVMTNNWVFSSPMNVVEGKTLKIEMNGFTISRQYTRVNFPSDGQVIVMHPGSKLYLIGSEKPNTDFNIHSTYNHRTINVTSGGLVYEGRADEGGGIYMKKGSELHLDNVTIAGNKAKYGGGIYVDGQNCYIYMKNGASLENNDAEGGGIYSDADGTHIYMESNSRITNNDVSASHGGAVYFNYSWFSIESPDGTGIISDNKARNGGAIYVCSRTFGSNNGVIKGLTIENNEASNYGGGLYLDQNNTVVEDCKILNNAASYSGGGIYTNGKNTLKNVSITGNKCNHSTALNNNDEGGGVYCASGYDLTLSGKVTIKNNYRMNANKEQWWNPAMEGGSNYRPGFYGYSDDDTFLGGSGVYLIANSLDSSSLIGIRTGQSGDKKCVKNVSSFNWGHTFFLNLGSSFHIGYESKDKEIWQRVNSTKYTVTINGKEIGRFDYGQKVTVNGDSADGVFTSWSCVNFELTDEQKKNNTLTFEMPSYDVDLIATYNTAGTDNVSLTVDSPMVGEELAKQGSLNWTINNVGHAYTVDLTWYDETGEVVTKAEANKTYYFKTSVLKDASKYLVFSNSIGNKNVKVTYKDSLSENTNFASSASVDSNGALSVQGFNVSGSVATYKLSSSGLSTMLEKGASKADILSAIPDTVKGTNTSSSSTKEFTLDKENINFTGVLDSNEKLIQPDGDIKVVTLTVPVLNLDNVGLASDSVTFYILVTSSKTVITSINYTKDINVNEGDGKDELLKAIKDAKATIKGYVDESEYSGKIGTRYISDNDLTKLLEDAGLLEDDKVVYLENSEGKYEYTVETTVTSNLLEKVELGDNAKSATFIIQVTPQNKETKQSDVDDSSSTPSNNVQSEEDKQSLVSTNDENNIDSGNGQGNQEFALTNGDSYAIETCSDSDQTNGEVGELKAPSISSDNNKMYYDREDVNGEDVVLDNETIRLKITLSVESVDGVTPTICYKVFDGESEFMSSEGDSVVTLSANAGDEKDYTLEVYSKLNDKESEHDFYYYTLDNTNTVDNNKTITLTINYTDGITESKKETLSYTSGSSFYLALPIIDGYSSTGLKNNGNSNVTMVQSDDYIDLYLYRVTNLNSDISVSATYMPVITTLDIENSGLTVGETLPTIGKIKGILIDNKTEIDLTDYFTSKTWSEDGKTIDSNSIVLGNTQYKLLMKADFGILDYFFMGDLDINNSSASAIGTNTSMDNQNGAYIDIIFPTTIEVMDDEISYNLSGVKDLAYPELTYEQALALNKVEYGRDDGYTIVDNYNLPSKLFVTLNGNKEDALDITWNDYFSTSFDPNNYGEQELVIQGVVSKPDYIKVNNFNNKITLKIKVKAKYGYVPKDVLDNSNNKAVTCEEYMKSKDWTWSETKKACVYKVSNTSSK